MFPCESIDLLRYDKVESKERKIKNDFFQSFNKYDSYLKEGIADAGDIMFWRIATHKEIFQYSNEIWYHLNKL